MEQGTGSKDLSVASGAALVGSNRNWKLDVKWTCHGEFQQIPGGLPAKHYELAEGYEPSKILFSVDAIHDHCLRSSVSNVQLPRPDFPPQSSVLRSDMSSFRRNDPLTRLSNPTLFGWIWIPGWSWIRTIMDYINSRAS
ncbi:hypothetical protein KEM48_012721 [Puccinia striiformis f. sp. tritici PST-130]|nr:hypothetical protein KEM48_012721 [Puccinia striiformis f. sp. tritici PST-130]